MKMINFLKKSIKAVITIVSVCNTGNLLSGNLDSNLSGTLTSVNDTLSHCTNNRISFESIIGNSIHIPCNKVKNSNFDIYKFLSTFDKNLLRYNVFILPNVYMPSVAGLATVGPCSQKKKCVIYINELYAYKPGVYLHEIGHNLGLQHSYYNNEPYGDLSDIMGKCCSIRCFNAVHSKFLKLTNPQATLYVYPFKRVNVNFTLKANEYIMLYDIIRMKTYFIQNRKDNPKINERNLFFSHLNVYSSGLLKFSKSVLEYILKLNETISKDNLFISFMKHTSESVQFGITIRT